MCHIHCGKRRQPDSYKLHEDELSGCTVWAYGFLDPETICKISYSRRITESAWICPKALPSRNKLLVICHGKKTVGTLFCRRKLDYPRRMKRQDGMTQSVHDDQSYILNHVNIQWWIFPTHFFLTSPVDLPDLRCRSFLCELILWVKKWVTAIKTFDHIICPRYAESNICFKTVCKDLVIFKIRTGSSQDKTTHLFSMSKAPPFRDWKSTGTAHFTLKGWDTPLTCR